MGDYNYSLTASAPTTVSLSTLRTRLRRELHDEDSTAYRWGNDELDRHLDRAKRELSLVLPREKKTTLTTTAGSRDLDISALTDRVRIEAVEYPVGDWPPTYAQFSVWLDTLTLLVDSEPDGADSVYVYWGQVHELDGAVSSLPTLAEDLVVCGAGGYAALEWASYATNRANVGGADTWRNYQAWGEARLKDFAAGLERLGTEGRVRGSRLYAAERPEADQSTVRWEP